MKPWEALDTLDAAAVEVRRQLEEAKEKLKRVDSLCIGRYEGSSLLLWLRRMEREAFDRGDSGAGLYFRLRADITETLGNVW